MVQEKVITNTETNPNETVFNRMRRYIACADVLILGWSVTVTAVVIQLKEAALD
jgi:hypothetical protein